MPKPESILQSAKGGPYEKYAVVYTYNKIQINIAEILERWDKDHNIPEKLPRQEIREDGTIRNYRVDNPDAMVNKLLANSEIITRHQPEDYEYDENRKKIYGRKYDQGASPAGEEVPIDPEGADRELSEALKPIREAVDSYINSDDDDTKQFKEIIEINMVPMQYERGDFTRAMMDNLYLADLYSQTGGCPKIKNYTFKELREHLDGPIDPVTGKQTKPLKLISRYYKGINELFDMEYAKQKLMDKGYTPEDEKQYLEELKATQQQMIDAFDELKEFESEHKGEFDTTYLSNELYHLVDYERAPIAAIGQLKGQIQAINNGWSMDDLTVLGLLGAMNEQAAFNIRTNKKKLEDERKALERDQKALNEKETELAELRKTKDEEKIKKAENEVKKNTEYC